MTEYLSSAYTAKCDYSCFVCLSYVRQKLLEVYFLLNVIVLFYLSLFLRNSCAHFLKLNDDI